MTSKTKTAILAELDKISSAVDALLDEIDDCDEEDEGEEMDKAHDAAVTVSYWIGQAVDKIKNN